MSRNLFDDITEEECDVLCEVGNIGAGHAANSLSQLLLLPVDLDVPEVQILDYETAAKSLGGAENYVTALLLQYDGDLTGMIMFVFQNEFSESIIKCLIDDGDDEEMAQSALKEIGNIMASSYVNAIADMTGLRINVSIPYLSRDMVGSILSVPAIYFSNISDKIILIDTTFKNKAISGVGNVLMLPEIDALKKLLTSLGIDSI